MCVGWVCEAAPRFNDEGGTADIVLWIGLMAAGCGGKLWLVEVVLCVSWLLKVAPW